MRLFMRGNVEKGLKDFEDGLEKYFSTSRRYRSSVRRGSIVLLDNNNDMFNFFMFLVKKCGLEVGVVHVDNVSCAKKAVEDLGPRNVKAVVIDESMLGQDLNGDSLISWLAIEHPRIPVWAVNCDEERREWIRSQTSKVGVLDKDDSLGVVADAVGFPDECQEFVAQYSG